MNISEQTESPDRMCHSGIKKTARFLSLALFLNAFAATAESAVEMTDPGALACVLPQRAWSSPLPGQNPQNLKFLFCKDGLLYLELTYDAPSVRENFRKEFPGEPDYGFGVPLSEEKQAWIRTRCRERLGDTFVCIEVTQGKTMIAHLKSIAGYAEGGNGDVGFVGVLDAPSFRPLETHNMRFGEELVGIAYPGSRHTPAKARTIHPLSTEERDVIQTLLRKQLGDPTCSILSAVRNPKDGEVLAVAEYKRTPFAGRLAGDGTLPCSPHEKRCTSVFCLLPGKPEARLVPFGDVPYAIEILPEKGFPLDMYPGCRDKTRFFFLPDINHDGWSEVLVSACEDFVFSPSCSHNGSAMELLHGFHYGLRE